MLKIREIRKSQNIGLNELARNSQLSPAYLSSLERGLKNNPSLEIIKKVASALNCSVSDLISEESKASQ